MTKFHKTASIVVASSVIDADEILNRLLAAFEERNLLRRRVAHLAAEALDKPDTLKEKS